MEAAVEPLFDPETARARKLRQLQWLDGAGDAVSTEIKALKLQAEIAMEFTPALPSTLRALSLDRMARAVRFICAMIWRVENGEPEPSPRLTARQQTFIDTRKADVAEMVEHVIDDQAESPEAVESLIERLDTRIERERPERFAHLPLGQMVQTVCHDVGLAKPHWEDWQEEPWAKEEILTQPAGSPYVGYPRGALRLDRAQRRRAARHDAAKRTDYPEVWTEPDIVDDPPMTPDEWARKYAPPDAYATWRAEEDAREAAKAAAKAAHGALPSYPPINADTS